MRKDLVNYRDGGTQLRPSGTRGFAGDMRQRGHAEHAACWMTLCDRYNISK